MHSKTAENSQEVSDEEMTYLTSQVSSNLNTSSITDKTGTDERILLHRTDLQEVSGPIPIKLKS